MIWKRNAEKFRICARSPVSDGPRATARSLAVITARTRFEIEERLRIPADMAKVRSPKCAGAEDKEDSAIAGPGTSIGSEIGGETSARSAGGLSVGPSGCTNLSAEPPRSRCPCCIR
jgi:hypothetical protein